jgi:phosphoribosylamine-glycine ligase
MRHLHGQLETVRGAIAKAYGGVSPIRLEGVHYRKDIGEKGLKK